MHIVDGRRRLAALTALTIIIVALATAVAPPPAAAALGDTVLNPGPFKLVADGGGFFNVSGHQVDLPSAATPAECNNGLNDDISIDNPPIAQDTNIDFDGGTGHGVSPATPVDAQCAAGGPGQLASTDDSEAKPGYQARSYVTMQGTVDKNGVIAVAQANLTFPTFYAFSTAAGVLDITPAATAAVTGTLDPASGTMTLHVVWQIEVIQAVAHVDCIAPITMDLSSDAGDAVNNGLIAVAPSQYNTTTGAVALTSNTFSVGSFSPNATPPWGAPPTGAGLCNTVGSGFGAPAVAGLSAVQLAMTSDTTGGNQIFQSGIPGSGFHAVTPFRALDSRTGLGFTGPIGAGLSKDLPVAGVGTVPANAKAVVMNVTATGGTASSYLTAFPTGTPPPNAANLLFAAGQTVPNLVTAKIGAGGKVSFFNQLGTVHVVADIVGYFDDGAPAGDLFRGVTPARLLDSRGATGGWASTPLGPGETRPLTVRGAGPIPVTATAIVMNVTVTGATLASYLQVSPTGAAPTVTANLLFAAGQTVPNLVTVGIGTGGKVSFFNQLGTVHVIADAVGYFDPAAGGGKFHAINPTRVLDDRSGIGLSGAWAPNQSRALPVGGVNPIPASATGLVANVTATGGTAASYLTVYPDLVANPGTANLLFGTGQTVPNAVMVGVAANGKIDVYNQLGNVHVIADADGYYASF